MSTHAVFVFRGRLKCNATVRTKVSSDTLASIPIVCMELENLDCGVTRTLHAEQPFTAETRHQAETLARSLLAGSVVTVSAQLQDMRVSLPHVESITIH